MGTEFSNIESWEIINKFYSRIFGIYIISANRSGQETFLGNRSVYAVETRETGASETVTSPMPEKTFRFWKALFDEGVYTNAVISPAVAPDRAMLRTSIMATHCQEDLDRVLETFEKTGKQLSII